MRTKRFWLVLLLLLIFLAACAQNRSVDVAIEVECFEGEPCVRIDDAGFTISLVTATPIPTLTPTPTATPPPTLTPTATPTPNCAPTVQPEAIGPFPQPPQPCEHL